MQKKKRRIRQTKLLAAIILIVIGAFGCSEKTGNSPVKSTSESASIDRSVMPAPMAAEESVDLLPKYPQPEDVLAPAWLPVLKRNQLETRREFEVFNDFLFADSSVESGIDFEHISVVYACKINIASHYDHANGIVVADVDSDDLLDIYLTTQIGKNQLWKNLGEGKFRDISTPEIALADQIGASATFADTDNDGDPDLYVTSIRGGNFFFENDGKGQFSDRTASSGLGYNGHSSSGVFFDYNRDGLVDLFLCNVGVFTKDEVDSLGIHIPLEDAFAGHLKPAQRNERSILYKNLGNNRFSDVTEETGLIDNSWSGAASPLDVNEDGWPDLYVLNMQGHDEYYQNVEGKRFEKKSRAVFPKTSWGAMGIKVFDFDNDGKMDIYITDMHSDMSAPIELVDEKLKSKIVWPESMLRSGGNSIYGNSLFHNQGGGQYVEISDKVGAENYWPWGLSIGDLNADGYEDAFVASSMNYPFRYCVNKVLLNNKGERFLECEFILGVEPRRDGRTANPNFTLDPDGEDKEHQLVNAFNIRKPVEVWGALGTRSSAIFDLDNDGDLDIVTNEFNDGPMVLISNLSDKKAIHWLKVKLSGETSNADGLGALVQVHTDNRVYTKVNDGQSGYLSQSVIPLYFGLGEATMVEKIVVKWPTGKEQTVTGPIQSNRLIDIAEE
ncbi:MAG TPA: CRTAC1 family protein [Verrucomicrobiales bacterium]|nr:CRTAC1 family protein [Verrucomicrobiales bacterium]